MPPPPLTKSRESDVRAVLDKSIFGSLSFLIENGKSDREIVVIRFIDNPNFYIRLGTANRTIETPQVGAISALLSPPIRTTEKVMVSLSSPGDCVETEEKDVYDFDDFLSAVSVWISRLRKELSIVRFVDEQFDEFKATVNRMLDEHVKDPSVHFTPEERDEVR